MKKRIIICSVLIVLVLLGFAGYHIYRYPATFRHLKDKSIKKEQVEKLKDKILEKENPKILVSYFSYSGTTKQVATTLSRKTGADLFEIKPQKSYSNVYTQSNREIRKGDRPALTKNVSNINDYDIVFVGYPVWWHATPAAVNTFLESNDLKGKLIIPFCTSSESDIEETMPTFLDSCDGLAVYGQKRISENKEIDRWLKELGLTKSKTKTAKTNDTNKKGKTLIAYFSWSGNTESMASYIQKQINGDLLKLEPEKAYPTNYDKTGEVAKKEQDENARPKIKDLPKSISEYDTIFVGYPIWWHTAPMIIGTFLENYDLTGVQIYPFTQSASMDTSQFENSMKFIRKNAKGAKVHDGLFVDATDTDGISDYLKENGIIKKQ